ncbi:MAG: family 16 glycoside hydrolase [Bacteroidia bacterium]
MALNKLLAGAIVLLSAHSVFAQDCTVTDPAKLTESIQDLDSKYERHETEAFYSQSTTLLPCANSILYEMTDLKKKEELRKRVGKIWYERAIVSGQKGEAEHTIYNRACAMSYGYTDEADACKIFQQTVLHNKKNVRVIPSGGVCKTGDCIQGWGKYEWTNGATYEGEWLNGLMSGVGTYSTRSGELWWSRHWKYADPSYETPTEVPPVEGYPLHGPVLFGHTGTSTIDPKLSTENGILTVDNAVQGRQDNYVYTCGQPVYDDFEVEVTVNIKDGPLTQGNGIVFRSWGYTCYLFTVTGDGRTAFYTCTPGQWTWHKLTDGQTAGKTLHPSVKMNAPNTLKAVAKGSMITIFMNGQQLGSFKEPLQLRGNLGVYVSANNVVSFSDFKIGPAPVN